MISEGSDIMNRLKIRINNEDYLEVDFELVGSGAKNLITQNGNEPPDVDFNFVIHDMNGNYKESDIKDYMKENLDNVLKEKEYRHGSSDSTSVLTNKSVPVYKNAVFNVDVAIIKIENDNWYRLIHEKHENRASDRWCWNGGIYYSVIIEKAEAIKEANGWEVFRDRYLERKDRYLKNNDYNHPSYVVYIEIVNEVYKMYCDRGWI